MIGKEVRWRKCAHLKLRRRQVPVWSLWLCWTVSPRVWDLERQERSSSSSRQPPVTSWISRCSKQTLAGLAVLFFLAGLDWSSPWSRLEWGGSDWPEPWDPPDDPGWGLHACEREREKFKHDVNQRQEHSHGSHSFRAHRTLKHLRKQITNLDSWSIYNL